MRRRIAPAVLTAAALFLLSGCFKMDADITVHSDDTLSGTMVIAMDKEFMSMGSTMGEGDEFFEAEDIPEGATVEEYKDEEYVGEKMTFEGITFDELTQAADSDDEWTFAHDGDTYTFDGNMDLTFDEGEAAMMGKMLEGSDLRVAITFPGKITDTNGEADGNTVVWHPKVGEKNPMHAEAVEGGFPLLPVLGGALLLGAGGAAFLLRKRVTPVAAGAPHAATGPVAAPGEAPTAAPTATAPVNPVQQGGDDEAVQGWSATDSDDWADPTRP